MKIFFIRHAQKIEDKYNNKTIKSSCKKIKKTKVRGFLFQQYGSGKTNFKDNIKKINLIPKIENSLNEFKTETLKNQKKNWNNEEKTHYDVLINFLNQITTNPIEDKSILIVYLGLTNRMILSHFLKLNPSDLIRFIQDETGVNLIYWENKFKNWRLKTWNNNQHLNQSPLPFSSSNFSTSSS